MRTLNGGCGGKSPAGTTCSLVLHWIDSTKGSPVNLGWSGDDCKVLVLGVRTKLLWTVVSEKFHELVVSPGGELVVADGEGIGSVRVDLS